ncbi:Fic/DOC family protein [Cryptosporangium sp. NPDC048952]|uniref:Fic/DOC family protein n=1 Tax=Cryptosporangium sp. NPDC048952 TaxID=3363961 RepID=UPI00371A5E22
MSDDPYSDPLSGVLRNRLGISNPDRLQEVETALSRAALAELAIHDMPGSYDLPHLQAFHRELFDDIYPWAGSLRTVWIAKTAAFCPPQHIESYATAVFGSLAKERCLRGLDRASFVDRLTHY